MAEFRMPSLGADMEEGTLTQWLVKSGDTVTKGEVVAVIETAKADIEVECFESGTVTRLLAEPGTVLPVGAPLAEITPAASATTSAPAQQAAAPAPAPQAPEPSTPLPQTGAEPAPVPVPAAQAAAVSTPGPQTGAEPASVHAAQAAAPSTPATQRSGEPDPAPQPAAPRAAAPAGAEATRRSAGPLVRHLAQERHLDLTAVHGTGRGGRVTRADVERAATAPPCRRVRATPLARRLAAESGVDLAAVRGTGEGGAVRAADVRAAAAIAPPAPDGHAPTPRATNPRPERADRHQAMRQATAQLMSRSKREIPHYYLARTVDMTRAMAWMREHNRSAPVARRLVPAALLLKAAALAARRVPELNGFWEQDRFHPATEVHLGTAVSLRGGGLVAPALRDADTLALPELMTRLKDLTARARTGRLRASETGVATVTVTSMGDLEADAVYGVIHPPQVALVGFGTVRERPAAVDGLLGVRPTVTVTLAADHRASDGATGARYLAAVQRLLQHPEEL